MTVETRIKKLEAVASPAKAEVWGSVTIAEGDDAAEAIRAEYGDNPPPNMMIVRLVSSRHYAGDPRCGCRDCRDFRR